MQPDTLSHPSAVSIPQQEELPLAIVKGSAITKLPQDLYIPPAALEVILETFEGPLDLLLYLIKKQNLDILDIPIAKITEQYISYIETIQDLKFELAAEYLVMAAVLAEIKSKILLPRKEIEKEEETDPRAELVRRLQEYEQFKQAAENVDNLPRLDRDYFLLHAEICQIETIKHPDVSLEELLEAMKNILTLAEKFTAHEVKKDSLSIREQMTYILNRFKVQDNKQQFIDFQSLFKPEEGRRGVVVTFMAVLELMKQRLIEVVQNTPYGTIHIHANNTSTEK